MEIKLERDKRYFNEISGLAVVEFSVFYTMRGSKWKHQSKCSICYICVLYVLYISAAVFSYLMRNGLFSICVL